MGYSQKQGVNAMCPLILWILRALPTAYGHLAGLIGTKHSCGNALTIMSFIYNLSLLLLLNLFQFAWYHWDINSMGVKNKL